VEGRVGWHSFSGFSGLEEGDVGRRQGVVWCRKRELVKMG
jgi:hypothetical protein